MELLAAVLAGSALLLTMALLFHLLRRRGRGLTFAIRLGSSPELVARAPGSNETRSAAFLAGEHPSEASRAPINSRRPEQQPFDLRSSLKRIYKILTTLIALVLLAGAGLAWWAATPANGGLLVSGVLGILSLIMFLSISKLDRRDEQVAVSQDMFRDMRQLLQVSTIVEQQPVVRSMNSETVARAVRMQRQGAALDAICADVEPDYASWDGAHQQAFQQVIAAMLRHHAA